MIDKVNFTSLKLANASTREDLAKLMNKNDEIKTVVSDSLASLDRLSGTDRVFLSTQPAHQETLTGRRVIVNNEDGKVIAKTFIADDVTPYHIQRKLNGLTQEARNSLNAAPQDTDSILDYYV